MVLSSVQVQRPKNQGDDATNSPVLVQEKANLSSTNEAEEEFFFLYFHSDKPLNDFSGAHQDWEGKSVLHSL